MTVTFNISVADALDWFGLDDTNVTEQKVKYAFKLKAKSFHPDTKSNFKDKLSATENFIAAMQAKETLLTALKNHRLPRETLVSTPPSEDGKESEHQSRKGKSSAHITDYMSARRKYDYRNKTPVEAFLEVPIVGDVFGIICILFSMLSMTGHLFIVVYPLALIQMIFDIAGHESTFKSLKQKFTGYISGLLAILLDYIFMSAGVVFFTMGNDNLFPYALAIGWTFVSILSLDEIYSMVRYWFISKKIKREMVACE